MSKSFDDLVDQYAQQCVDDMDLDSLMDAVKEHIEERMREMPRNEAIAEIEESCYSELLEGFDNV